MPQGKEGAGYGQQNRNLLSPLYGRGALHPPVLLRPGRAEGPPPAAAAAAQGLPDLVLGGLFPGQDQRERAQPAHAGSRAHGAVPDGQRPAGHGAEEPAAGLSEGETAHPGAEHRRRGQRPFPGAHGQVLLRHPGDQRLGAGQRYLPQSRLFSTLSGGPAARLRPAAAPADQRPAGGAGPAAGRGRRGISVSESPRLAGPGGDGPAGGHGGLPGRNLAGSGPLGRRRGPYHRGSGGGAGEPVSIPAARIPRGACPPAPPRHPDPVGGGGPGGPGAAGALRWLHPDRAGR